jgi:hypothetical protein
MAEVLHTFDTLVGDALGQYQPQAVGRLADDNMWEGWLEFFPTDGSGEVLVSSVESRQPEREHLVYWSTGLSPVYLEGALARARRAVTAHVRASDVPYSNAPKPRHHVTVARSARSVPEPVLDPFEIGSRSLDLLRQELGALNRPRLLNIIAAFDLNPSDEDPSWMSDHQLAHFIVVAVEMRLPQRTR